MTKQSDIIGDPKYLPLLNAGFVGIKDVMGNDADIVQAARVSYAKGTRAVSEDRGLIRYLMRHYHGTPFEMTSIKLHVRCPIFVMRQWQRHRIGYSINEESARYSEMVDEFYMPEPDVIQPQSKDNKQGRSGEISDFNKKGVEWVYNAAYENSYLAYRTLLGEKVDNFYDLYDPEDPMFDEEFPGIAREVARSAMPTGSYTEMYWQANVRSLFSFLQLRADSHAQYEVRVYADAIIKLIQPYFPLAFEAWEDYVRQAKTLSRMEVALMRKLLNDEAELSNFKTHYAIAKENKKLKVFSEGYEMSVREMTEFMETYFT